VYVPTVHHECTSLFDQCLLAVKKYNISMNTLPTIISSMNVILAVVIHNDKIWYNATFMTSFIPGAICMCCKPFYAILHYVNTIPTINCNINGRIPQTAVYIVTNRQILLEPCVKYITLFKIKEPILITRPLVYLCIYYVDYDVITTQAIKYLVVNQYKVNHYNHLMPYVKYLILLCNNYSPLIDGYPIPDLSYSSLCGIVVHKRFAKYIYESPTYRNTPVLFVEDFNQINRKK
jgi:hypothetical protein